jgi:hypothetical protein
MIEYHCHYESGGSGHVHQWRDGASYPILTLHRSAITNYLGCVHVNCYAPWGIAWLRVPPEALASLAAGDHPAPVLDYLVEAYGDRHPWLAEAVLRVAGAVNQA